MLQGENNPNAENNSLSEYPHKNTTDRNIMEMQLPIVCGCAAVLVAYLYQHATTNTPSSDEKPRKNVNYYVVFMVGLAAGLGYQYYSARKGGIITAPSSTTIVPATLGSVMASIDLNEPSF
jgi:hypothetical protein